MLWATPVQAVTFCGDNMLLAHLGLGVVRGYSVVFFFFYKPDSRVMVH